MELVILGREQQQFKSKLLLLTDWMMQLRQWVSLFQNAVSHPLELHYWKFLESEDPIRSLVT